MQAGLMKEFVIN